MAEIKGILFDKDGTLVDFQKTWYGIADLMALHAAKGDRGKADRLMVKAGYDYGQHRFRADSVFAAGTNADIVALWYPRLGETRRREMTVYFDTVTAEQGALQSVPLPGSQDAVASLHRAGFRLGVATNDSTGGAEKALLALGIAQMFDAAYGYDAVANPKPAPDTVQAFSDLTGLKPSEIAVIGDNRHDLEMARAGGAGLAVGVLSGTGTRELLLPLADVVLESVVDLPAYLAVRAPDECNGSGLPRSARPICRASMSRRSSWRICRSSRCRRYLGSACTPPSPHPASGVFSGQAEAVRIRHTGPIPGQAAQHSPAISLPIRKSCGDAKCSTSAPAPALSPSRRFRPARQA